MSALETEIKPSTSIFNHKAATPNAVVFLFLCSSRVHVRSPGDVEKMGQVQLFPGTGAPSVLRKFNTPGITSTNPFSAPAASPAGDAMHTKGSRQTKLHLFCPEAWPGNGGNVHLVILNQTRWLGCATPSNLFTTEPLLYQCEYWACGRKLPALGRMGKDGTQLRSSDLLEHPPRDKNNLS